MNCEHKELRTKEGWRQGEKTPYLWEVKCASCGETVDVPAPTHPPEYAVEYLSADKWVSIPCHPAPHEKGEKA